jgi:hypothetical protein
VVGVGGVIDQDPQEGTRGVRAPQSLGRSQLPPVELSTSMVAKAYAAVSAARTSSAWLSGFTRRMIFDTFPSASITNVERS